MWQNPTSKAIRALQILEDSAVPIAGIFFLSSMWHGWQLTPQLVSDLATNTFTYDSQSLNYYLNLQWTFFLLGIFSIAFFFFFRALDLLLADPKKECSRAIVVTLFVAAASVSVFTIQKRTYSLYFPNQSVEVSEPQLSSIKPDKSSVTNANPSTPEAKLSKEESSRTSSKSDSNLVKEAVSAFKDLNSYLMNWAILLLTGISALLVYRLNLFPR